VPQRDHFLRHHRVRRDRPQAVRHVEPDAPLSLGGAGRSRARDHAPVSARQNRRGPRRHPLGRCGQYQPAYCMIYAARLYAELEHFKRDVVYKRMNNLEAPQAARTKMQGRGEVVILSSNNYLGLCNAPDVVAAGKRALDEFGAGTGSVRFICGTFTIHRELEQALARFVGCESSLTYVSCWNANEGLVPTLLGEQDIVISDQLNHASIIDAIRLAKTITKCQTAVYKHSDLADLEAQLRAARDRRLKLIFTDGIFSMEGDIARLPDLLELGRKYDAVVAVDDSHATGVLGKTGRGTAEHFGVLGEVPIITS